MCLVIGLETVFAAAVGLGWWLAIGMGKKRNASGLSQEIIAEVKS
jgi:hypothetical protein